MQSNERKEEAHGLPIHRMGRAHQVEDEGLQWDAMSTMLARLRPRVWREKSLPIRTHPLLFATFDPDDPQTKVRPEGRSS